MVNAYYLRSLSGDTYFNLAVEEYIMDNLPEYGLVLFLWHSDNAVVIGRHQNPWLETDGAMMIDRGVVLARRMSGGGAVYQDHDCLNFSFIADARLFDINGQLRAVCDSLVPYGIRAVAGRRKDLCVFGRKFSGSAFAFRRGRALHHGTLLVNTDLEMMRALHCSLHITGRRGICSEHARVINLGSLNPDISVEGLASSLRAASEDFFGRPFRETNTADFCDTAAVARLREKYCSWEWRYGATPPFDAIFDSDGNCISMRVERGRVGPVMALPGGNILMDAGGTVRFHRGEVRNALAGIIGPGDVPIGAARF